MKKILSLLIFIMLTNFSSQATDKEIRQLEKANAKRALLTKLRNGDYAHAGDVDGINFLIKRLPNIETLKEGNILDLGSGYGGTAFYMKQHGFKKVWGLDIDKNAVDYSNLKYPTIKFFHLDAKDLTKQFRKNFFSFIYMFNVIYSIEDKESLLKNLAKVSEKGSVLAVFDYSKGSIEEKPMDKKQKKAPALRDFAGNKMYPIDTDKFKEQLAKTGWKVLESSNITNEYIEWYQEFLTKLSDQKAELVKAYQEKDVENVENLFNKILFKLKNDELRGVLILAEKV